MGFLVPAFLAGFAALGIPLLMHLRDRNEETPTRFPSLMFLVRLPIRTSDRRKVTDWPLLLLRALAVAILVLAFSRPFLGSAAMQAADRRARMVVLLLDRSMSMGYSGTWAAAQDSARALLASLALLMLAADAGFAYAGSLAEEAENSAATRSRHRTVAIMSSSVALVSYLMMLPPLRRD